MLHPQAILVPGHTEELVKAPRGSYAVFWRRMPLIYKIINVF